jgi:excisionase family DNA binding protein
MGNELSLQALGAQLASIPEILKGIRAELEAIRLILGTEPSPRRLRRVDLLSASEAAELLGLSEATLATWRCTRRYEIPYLKLGRHVRYRRQDLEEWLTSRQGPPTIGLGPPL